MGTGDILVKNTRMEEWKNMRMEKKNGYQRELCIGGELCISE